MCRRVTDASSLIVVRNRDVCLQVTTEDVCVLVPLVTEFKVAKVQEAAVLVYDYYEPREQNVMT